MHADYYHHLRCARFCVLSFKPPVTLWARYLLPPSYKKGTDTEGLCHMPSVVRLGVRERRGEFPEKRKVIIWSTCLWRKGEGYGTQFTKQHPTTRNASITKNSLLKLILKCNRLFIILQLFIKFLTRCKTFHKPSVSQSYDLELPTYLPPRSALKVPRK